MLGKLLKGRLFPKRLLALGFLLGLALIVYIYHPGSPFQMIPCPFREITGLYCPGCGSIRAMTQVVQGNLGRAVQHNVLAVIFLPLLVWVILSNIKLVITGKALPYPRLPAAGMWLVLIIFILFAVLRNLPIPQLQFLQP